MPKVSVIIPNYNHASFLKARIKSVLEQTFTDIEVILLDDCSTDNSVELIKVFQDAGASINIVPNKVNSGSPFIQWNKGVSMAKAEYIWIAESDDVADISFLDELVYQLDQNPNVALAYCQSNKMDASGSVTGSWKDWTDDLDLKLFAENFTMSGLEYIERFLIHRNTIPNASAVLFRKSVYEQIEGADENIKNCSDWLTWLKMLLNHDVAFVSKPLNYFRYHANSVIALAHSEHSTKMYQEMYDRKMRETLVIYISDHKVAMRDSILKHNIAYIYSSIGNEGIFKIKDGEVLNGWMKVIKATIKLNFKLGFFKRAIMATSVKL